MVYLLQAECWELLSQLRIVAIHVHCVALRCLALDVRARVRAQVRVCVRMRVCIPIHNIKHLP